MAVEPISLKWRGDRAVLLVHGVGNAKPGDYADLVRQLEAILGPEAARTAIYPFYYDQINDWFKAKVNAELLFQKLLGWIRAQLAATNIGAKIDPAALGNAIANFAGDVIWPVLVADARHAVRLALIAQLQRIVRDGQDAGLAARRQRLTIIAHSMGCFHVYEALHAVARDPSHQLAPATWGVQFANVVMMASPVQLISSVAKGLGAAVPLQESLHCVSSPLGMPTEASGGNTIPSARNAVSIVGNLDPVGGYFFRTNPAWAYMNLPGQRSIVDQQRLATIGGSDELDLRAILTRSLNGGGPPTVEPQNPHSWSEYVRRHEAELRQWIV